MIDFYSWWTPNGWKIGIMLEECGLDYAVHGVNIGKGDQFKEEFLKISPNNRIPAIIDQDGPGGKPLSLFESGAILQYLGRKTGKFYSADERKRAKTDEWLMWQMANFGPMLGQTHHFLLYAPTIEKREGALDYGQNRYRTEARRLYGVLDDQLSDYEFVAGDDLSIADFAIYPWAIPHKLQDIDFADFPNVSRWFETLRARPKVQAGYEVLKAERDAAKVDAEESAKNLFGQKQKERHHHVKEEQ